MRKGVTFGVFRSMFIFGKMEGSCFDSNRFYSKEGQLELYLIIAKLQSEMNKIGFHPFV